MSEAISTTPENGLSAALENLFSDPQAKDRFEKIVTAMKENLPKQEPGEEAPTAAPPDPLTAMLSNPALMESLPTLLAGMRKTDLPESREKSPEDRRRDLLLALKPFLSKDRENAVDLILQISRLGAVLRMMQ